jgi:hypothetical protein
MLSFLSRTWWFWWALALGLGLRWHYVVVGGFRRYEYDALLFEGPHDETAEIWLVVNLLRFQRASSSHPKR